MDGGVDLLKTSDHELRAAGLLCDDLLRIVVRGTGELRKRRAESVSVTRGFEPLLLLDETDFLEFTFRQLQVADTRGAGDALSARVVAGLYRGEPVPKGVTLGAAAGGLHVTRHGRGTGDPGAIERVGASVRARQVPNETENPPADSVTAHVSSDGLAALADPNEDANSEDAS